MQSYADVRFRCFGFDSDMDMESVRPTIVKSKSGKSSLLTIDRYTRNKTNRNNKCIFEIISFFFCSFINFERNRFKLCI